MSNRDLGARVRTQHIDDGNDIGQRIDNYLMRVLKGVPRQHVYKILRSGEVRVNGGRAKPTYRLQAGDQIRIPPVRTRAAAPVRVTDQIRESLADAVLYESRHLLVINKPAGLAVHGGSSVSTGVVEALRVVREMPRLQLVHRLDRGTSGCLALAKTAAGLRAAQACFRQRSTKKIYQLLAWGEWPSRTNVVQARLKRVETPWGERRVRVDPEGQPARTDFSVLHSHSAATWLQAALQTGRTHQIRVHAQSVGHPVIGDDKYLADAAAEAHAKLVERLGAAPRLCLHAYKLGFDIEDESVRVTAAVPTAMEDVWRTLTAG